jgi:hypothetical protein
MTAGIPCREFKMDDEQPDLMLAGAAGILRGLGRHMMRTDNAVLAEMPLANGRRADIVAIDHQGSITIIEIKSCLADFRADRKWQDYLDYCDHFYFAVDADFPHDVLPAAEGMIVADAFGAEIVRPSVQRRLSAARRKAMTVRFGRCAAGRLYRWIDPGLTLDVFG